MTITLSYQVNCLSPFHLTFLLFFSPVLSSGTYSLFSFGQGLVLVPLGNQSGAIVGMYLCSVSSQTRECLYLLGVNSIALQGDLPALSPGRHLLVNGPRT